MAENEAKLILTAETQRFNQAMDSAQQKVNGITGGISSKFRTMANDVTAHTQQMSSNVSGHFASMGGAFTRVNGILIGFAALLAGGVMFKAAVSETVELEKAAVKLGRQLGIGATEASVLQVTLDDVYQDVSQLEAGMGKLVKTLNTDEEAITRLGVATRDQNGHFRGQLDIMLDVNSKLSQFKEGTDRNVEGMKIYGKSWKDVEPLIALTRDRMEESRKKAQELGLIVGVENVAALNKYRSAMNDAGDVMTGIKKVIGDALLPILGELANWFSSVGPQVVYGFKIALGSLAAAFWYLKDISVAVWQTISGSFRAIGNSFIGVAKAASEAVKGDFQKAYETLGAYGQKAAKNISDSNKTIEQSVASSKKKIDELFGVQTATPGGKGGANATSGDEDKAGGGAKRGGAGSRVSELETALATERYHYEQSKLAAGSFQEYSKKQEADYWQRVLDTEKLSAKDRDAIQRKFFESSREIAKANFAEKISQLKIEETALRKDSEERIRIAKEIAAAEAQRYGATSPQAQKSQADVAKVELEVLLAASKRAIDLTREGSQERYTIIAETAARIRDTYGLDSDAAQQAMAQVKALGEQEAEFRKTQAAKALDVAQQAAKSGLAIHEETIRQRLALGVISQAEELKFLDDAKEQEYQAEKTNLERKLQLYAADETKFAEFQAKLGEIEQRRMAEALAAQRAISAVQRGDAEDSARGQIADLNAEIASLRSNSPGRVDRAQQAVGIATAAFKPGSTEQGNAAGVLAREEAAAEKIAQDERVSAAFNGAAERLRIAYEESEKVRALVGEGDSAYEASQQRLTAAREAFLSGEVAIAERQLGYAQQSALQKLNIERETLAQQAQLGEINAQQQIQMLQLFAQQEYDIERQTLDGKYALYEEDIQKREDINQRKLELDRNFQANVSQLRTQELQEQSAEYDAGLNPIAAGMARMFNQMADGALTWRKAMSQVVRSARVEAINMAVEVARNYIRSQIIQTQAHLAGNAIRGAADKQSALMSVAQAVWAAIKIIGIKAWETAAAVYASISSIYMIGPFLAPAMAVAAAATVIGFVGRIASAEGGYDIPAGVNPMVQTHAREMILPAQYADVIRGMAGDGGGGGGGGGVTVQVSYGNVSAIDARGMKEVLNRHANDIGDVVLGQIRNFRKV